MVQSDQCENIVNDIVVSMHKMCARLFLSAPESLGMRHTATVLCANMFVTV